MAFSFFPIALAFTLAHAASQAMVCAPSIPVIAPFEHPHARALTHLVMLTFPLWQEPPSDLPHGRLLRN